MIGQHSPLLPVSSYNIAQLHLALADPKNDAPFVHDLSHPSPPAICAASDLAFSQRRMSTSTASAPDTDTSSLQDKRLSSASASPRTDNRPRSDDAHTWSFDDNQSALDNTPKVQLPSIFTTFEDPFRSDIRRASLPDSASNTRHRASPYPQLSRRSHAPTNQSNSPTYQFPSSVDTQDPRRNYNSFSEPSPYPQSSLPSAPASMSSFASPLSPDLRQQVSYVEVRRLVQFPLCDHPSKLDIWTPVPRSCS
ncbi:hypothetical protein HD554DRAFT_758336 [Boletus coccyginus]|nr:hypothetical protein HD554DRAFT_758336 [Boletus coccyginus]